MDDIEAADKPEGLRARMVVLAHLRGPLKARPAAAEDQLSLFS